MLFFEKVQASVVVVVLRLRWSPWRNGFDDVAAAADETENEEGLFLSLRSSHFVKFSDCLLNTFGGWSTC